MMKKEDSPSSASRALKPTSSSVKSSRKLSAPTRSHTLSLTMPEPSDSHIQTSMQETASSTIWKTTKLSAGSQTNQDIWLTLLAVTTSVESEQSSTLKSIWAASISSTWRMVTERLSAPEVETSSSSATRSQKSHFQPTKVSITTSCKKRLKRTEKPERPAKLNDYFDSINTSLFDQFLKLKEAWWRHSWKRIFLHWF